METSGKFVNNHGNMQFPMMLDQGRSGKISDTDWLSVERKTSVILSVIIRDSVSVKKIMDNFVIVKKKNLLLTN